MRTIQQMIQSEVLCCMSSIVSTLGTGYACIGAKQARDLSNLAEQAFELASPISDYEEAALQAGYKPEGKDGHWFTETNSPAWAASAQDVCEHHNLEPYDREVYEHWAVTDWFADKLIAAGEKVDKDFGNLCIWARTITGQAIHADGVIERIYAETHKERVA